MAEKIKQESASPMPDEQTFKRRLRGRNRRGRAWQVFYFLSIIIALLALLMLFGNVVNSAFGSIATTFEVEPNSLAPEGQTFADLSAEQLVALLVEREPNRIPVIVRGTLSQVSDDEFTESTLEEVVPNGSYPEGYESATVNEIRDLESEEAAAIFGELLLLNLSRAQLENLVLEEIVNLQVVKAWPLWDAVMNWEPDATEQARIEELAQQIEAQQAELDTVTAQISDLDAQATALREADATANADELRSLNSQISNLQEEASALRDAIEADDNERTTLLKAHITTDTALEFPEATLVRYHSWLDTNFLSTPMSSRPAQAGVRTALFGSMFVMIFVIIVSLPVGVGAAVYLEEYADEGIFSERTLLNLERRNSLLVTLPIIGWITRWLMRNANNLIETNVRNLAGVPSIIYGMLGLAIFVRILAPVTSGVAFGVNVVVPENERIVSLIEEALPVDYTLDADEAILTVETGGLITEAQADELVRVFRRLGTPGLTYSGNISLERAEREIASILDVTLLESIPAGEDELAYTDLAAGYIRFDSYAFTAEQFSALASQLRRVTSFTISGRTILSASLTLALLILPIIIIASQEALRAVPYTLREGSYGLGATKWQTISRTVLPAAIPGIMTGTILAISRAVGETAPLIVVGASTFLLTDPTGPFSQFTVLPIQIFDWTSRPQSQFQFIAAAAIIVLLVMVITLNAFAIIIRNRFSTRY